MPVSKLRAVPNNPHAFTQFRIQHNPKIAFMSVHHFGYEVSEKSLNTSGINKLIPEWISIEILQASTKISSRLGIDTRIC